MVDCVTLQICYFLILSFKMRNRKLLIIELSPKDRILHYTICKVTFLKIINFTQIMKDELFLMWVIKNQLDFNMPYFILKYLVQCFNRSNIDFLPYNVILTPYLQRLNQIEWGTIRSSYKFYHNDCCISFTQDVARTR